MSYLTLPYLTPVLNISACPMELWGQNINLMKLNYPSYSTARYNFKGKKKILYSGTQCHPPVLLNIISLPLNNHILAPIIKILSSVPDIPPNYIKS